MKVVFSRRCFQPSSGNLAHAHIILAIKKNRQASVFGVIISDNIEGFIAKNRISGKYEVDNNV